MAIPPARAVSLFYVTWFATLGIYLPYLNLYLDRIGLSGPQIGIISALVPLSGTLVPPFGGMLADRLGRRRGLIRISSFLAVLAFSIMFAAHSFVSVTLVIALYAVLRAPSLPLVEATAMEVSEGGGPHYGRMRAWGSLAFIVVALGAGRAVGLWGEGVILVLSEALLVLTFLSTLLLPGDRARQAESAPLTGFATILRRPPVLLFLAACVLAQAAHGPYYVFFTIHLERVGVAPRTIGLLWGIGVACEILVMLRMPAILKRFGPLPTMAASLILGAVRWWFCSWTTDTTILALVQTLHAATYAAFHVAAVTHAHRLFGRGHGASGQAVVSSASYGLGNILGMVLSGFLSARFSFPQLFGYAAWVALAGCLSILLAARRRRA